MSNPEKRCWNCQARPSEKILYQDGLTQWLCGACVREIDFVITQGKEHTLLGDNSPLAGEDDKRTFCA